MIRHPQSKLCWSPSQLHPDKTSTTEAERSAAAWPTARRGASSGSQIAWSCTQSCFREAPNVAKVTRTFFFYYYYFFKFFEAGWNTEQNPEFTTHYRFHEINQFICSPQLTWPWQPICNLNPARRPKLWRWASGKLISTCRAARRVMKSQLCISR